MRTRVFLNTIRVVLALPAALAGIVLLMPVLAVAAPFAVINALVRSLGNRLEPRSVGWTELVEFDEQLGWRTRPHLDTYAIDLAGDAFHLTTDENGWGGRKSLEESHVVVFGDSFAMGFGVDAGKFFAELPGQPGIKSIGAPAYSMVQPVLLIERLSQRLRGKLVVLLVYIGNDLSDSLRPAAGSYRAPFVRFSATEGTWGICQGHVSPEPWTVTGGELSYEALIEICGSTFKSERVFRAFEYLTARARDACRDAGADLVVMSVPELSPVVQARIEEVLAKDESRESFDPDLPDREMSEICEALEVGFVPLARYLTTKDYLKRDVHWNARGHAKVAAVLRHLTRDRKRAREAERGATPAREEASVAARRTG